MMLNQWTHRLYHVVALGALFCTAAFSQANNLLVSSSTLSFSALSGDTLPQQQFLAVSSATGSLPVTAAVRYFSATEGWLSVSPSTGSTPLTLTVTVNPTGIPAGAYLAQVTLIAGATQSTLVNVNLTVSGSTTSGGLLSVSPASLNLSSDLGVTAQSTVTISSGNATPFNVAISTSNGGNWLTTGASFATAPTSLTILANPVGLLAGIYSGNVTLIPSLGGTSLSIPVSFTVGTLTTSGLTVSPSTVNFSYQTGTAFPSAQPVLISYSSAIVSYLATASNSWIKLTSNQTNTPAQTVAGSSNTYLNVSADPTGLSPGFYSASIAIAASNLTVQTITVTLTVSNTALFNATPSSLSFNFLPGGVLPPSQQVTVSTTGSPLAFTVSSVSSGWLVAGPQNGQTNGQNVVTVSVNPGGLATGTYTGSVSVTSGSTSFSIPVTLTVGTSGFSGLVASPSSLSFQSQAGAPSQYQSLTISSLSPINFFATATSSGVSWLQVSPGSGITPATLTVTVAPAANLTPGTYFGSIQVNNLFDATQVTIPVTLTLTGGAIIATPQNLSFTQSVGGVQPGSQFLQVSTTGVSNFTTASSASWLTVSPTSSNAPTALTVTANGNGLSAGTYQGFVTISGASNTATVAVTLTIQPSASPTLTTTNLTFSSSNTGAAPASQIISVGSTGSAIAVTAVARTSSGGNWLLVSSNSNITPALLTVSVSPNGLIAGTYRGTITVTAAGGSDSRTADVTLIVTAPAGPTLQSVIHGASMQPTFMAPGLIVTVMGAGMGPQTGVSGTITSAGAVETTVSGVRVLFDGIPAPLLYVRDNQINAIAPYGLYGRVTTRVQVETNGVRSEVLELRVADSAPGLFTSNGSGRGQAAVLNQDGTVNSVSNPAGPSSILVLFATGEGQTFGSGQDGRIIATDVRKPLLPVGVTVGGVPVEVLYAGSAPGLVSGALQVNVKLNSQVPAGGALPVEVKIGNAGSQAGTTVAVR